MNATPNASSLAHEIPSAGGPVAFRDLYARNLAFVWRTLRRLGVRERDVEDAAQEAFLVAHRKLAMFDGASERGWLFAICLRVASDHRKRAHVRREQPSQAAPETAVPPDQLKDLERRRARELLQTILDALDDAKRSAFVLYELEELPMSEVAAILGCPLQTAYSRLHAARSEVQDAVRRASRGKEKQ